MWKKNIDFSISHSVGQGCSLDVNTADLRVGFSLASP